MRTCLFVCPSVFSHFHYYKIKYNFKHSCDKQNRTHAGPSPALKKWYGRVSRILDRGRARERECAPLVKGVRGSPPRKLQF